MKGNNTMNTTPQGIQPSLAIHPAEHVSKEPKDEPATSGEPAPEGKTTEAGQKKQTSPQKIASNRQNSKHSTGPTPEGKRRARRNALKHGFFSQSLLIGDPAVGEDPHEYNRLHDCVFAHYHPVGFEEELRCEEITSCIWKRRRLTRYETGLITRNLAEHRTAVRDLASLAEADPGTDSNPEVDITDHLSLPSNEDLERSSRYRSQIDRPLNFAIVELERLQAHRKLSAASFEDDSHQRAAEMSEPPA
jgi:hypothetical protein